LKAKPPQIDVLVDKLKKRGFKCTRTFFNYNALKIENLSESVKVLEEEIIKLGGNN
jgi:tRNA G26 N,N-dimethylase Trm1